MAATKLVPTELPNDPFDRQRCVEGWDQEKLSRQACLLLGVGGLGCGIALVLARLGAGKIVLVDKDTVDVTNLNRQLLFAPGSRGRPKVEAAAEGLAGHLVGAHTVVEKHHMDVLAEWPAGVRLAGGGPGGFNN